MPDIPDINDDKEVNLLEIFNLVRDNFKFCIFFISFFAISSILFSLLLPNKYTSVAVLEVMEKANEGGGQAFAGSSLAAITGISIGGSASAGDPAYSIMAIVNSRTFAAHLFTFDNILPSILAWQEYDPISQKLVYDASKYDDQKKMWLIPKPSYLTGFAKMHEALKITRSDESGFLYLSFEHVSPIFAHDFVSLIIKEVNSIRRAQDLKSADDSITYLYDQLEKTRESELLLSINQIIENQLRKRMLANIKDEYAIFSIDAPFVPLLKSSPTRSYIVIISTIVGSILALIILLTMKYGFQRNTLFFK